MGRFCTNKSVLNNLLTYLNLSGENLTKFNPTSPHFQGFRRRSSTGTGSKHGSERDPYDQINPTTIFNVFKNKETNVINIGQLLREIEKAGIRRTDPRLSGLINKINAKNQELGDLGPGAYINIDLDLDEFKKITADTETFLSQVFCQDLIIPQFDEFCAHIRRIYSHCKENRDGKVASYIPQLAKYNPEFWACSVCTVDGQRFSLGEVKKKFTVQSCSKPFTYAIALNELGSGAVHKFVSHEPSGRNFNEICLDQHGKPHNPMLNSGAIMIAAVALGEIHPEMKLAEKFDYMQRYLRRIAGNEYIGFNNSVFLSEREHADRNFAMAYYMKEAGAFPKKFDLQNTMDLYFQFCSLEVDTEALAVMGATLANGGICPTSQEKVLDPSCIRHVLSLMYSCGMYNYSGKFAFKVGLPAKSGVSGSLILVIPNTMAIALWSPPLDEIGNSVRGLQFSNELVDLFNFHRFDNLRFSEKKLDPTKNGLVRKGLTSVTLLFAATYGDVNAIRRHYLQGIDMNQTDYDGRTAIHVAAAEGHLNCVQFLLETGKVIHNPKDRWGFTPLQEAERFDHAEVAKLLKTFETSETRSGC